MTAFDELQRQLRDVVAASATAPAPRSRGVRWPRSLVLVLVGMVSVAGAAAAAVKLAEGDGTPESATALVGRVNASTLSMPACQIVSTAHRAQLVQGEPPASLRATWAFLRGRQVAPRLPRSLLEEPFGGPTDILSGSVRQLRSADGTRWWAFVARTPGDVTRLRVRDPAACLVVRRKRLDELAGNVDPATLALAQDLLAAQNRPQTAPPPAKRRTERVYGFAYSPPSDRAGITYSGPYSASNPYVIRLTRVRGTLRRYVTGLVPDRVVRVMMTMRSARPSSGRTTVAVVRDNTYSAVVPGRVTSVEIALRAASGKTIKSLRSTLSPINGP
jgi:hypothetical protein